MAANSDKNHALSVVASGAVEAFRFCSFGGLHATDDSQVVGVSENAAAVGDVLSIVTYFSYPVVCTVNVAKGDRLGVASDGTGRAVVVSSGGVGFAATDRLAGLAVECVMLPRALAAPKAAAVDALVSQYGNQGTIAAWYAGDINSVTTPSITADGDLATATDQVPLKWLAIINADDDVAAAQALLDGGPNVVEVLLGTQEQPIVYANDGVTPQIITRIYAVCISSSAAPADYTGGAYILSDLDTSLANALANMARFDFSAGLGATVARLVATPIYNTNYSQLSVAAGVTA